LPDDSGFFYTAHPKLGTVPKGEERYHEKTYFHKIGTKPISDKQIFGDGRPKEDMTVLYLSVDGRWLIISASLDWERYDLYLYDTKTCKTSDLIVGYNAKFEIVFTKEHMLLFTNYQAPNYRILYSDLKTPPNDLKLWKRLIPERKHNIDYYWLTTDKILVAYQINGSVKGYEFDYCGKEIAVIPMPKHASLTEISANKYETEYFYTYASFITPQVTMHYNPETRKYSELFRLKSTLNETDYEVKQEWFHSKDGTKVPMYIIHHRNIKLDGKNPTILSGYGGFESSNLPYFLRNLVPWLMRGGIFAIANIRGGGEFGKTWHTSAIRKNKQKSYDDFIAAAEHLIAKNYTNNQHLGIQGGSNGGLLVSTVAVQKPNLFKAVVSQVPLTDMVRFPKFLIASRWISEYGDPNDPKELKYILRYSPYHNVDKRKNYPAFLFTTAVNDTRVHPMHAYKMGALLQSLNGKEPVLIYTQNSAGHTGAQTMSRLYKNQARVLAFFAEQLDLKV
jgi:prolyl oligopeptidase